MANPEVNTGRRRVPRRNFECPVGVLLGGHYTVERSYQVGEGGMMISCRTPIAVGTNVAASFFLTSNIVIIVRGVVRSVVPAKEKMPVRYGIEFTSLDFQYKREIRNFVAAATRLEGHLTF